MPNETEPRALPQSDPWERYAAYRPTRGMVLGTVAYVIVIVVVFGAIFCAVLL